MSYGSSSFSSSKAYQYHATTGSQCSSIPEPSKPRSHRKHVLVLGLWLCSVGIIFFLVQSGGQSRDLATILDVPNSPVKTTRLDTFFRGISPIANQSYFYKFTYPVANSTGLAGFEKLTKYLCPAMADPDDLGCNALKVGCTVLIHQETTFGSGSSDFELHLVDAGRFKTSGLTMKQWQEYFVKLNDNMERFTSFSHNKVTIFSSDLPTLQHNLDKDDVPYMARLSGNDFAHIVVEVNGRLFEVVGSKEGLANPTKFLRWTKNECLSVHRPKMNVAYYSSKLTALMEGTDDAIGTLNGFSQATGMSPLLFIGASIATSNINSPKFDTLTSDMSTFSGAKWSKEEYSDSCSSLVAEWDQMPGLRIQYVENNAVTSGIHPVKNYEEAVKNAHIEYLFDETSNDWFGWDHWLDQHIGLVNTVYNFYGDDTASNKECLDLSREITSSLQHSKTPVGQRLVSGSSNQTHFYSGYHGTMAWEYNQNCYEWEEEAVPGICACNAQNNDLVYLDKTGSMCA